MNKLRNQRSGIDWRRFEHLPASVRKPIETASTLPPACYTDEEIFARERETIFRKSWIGIGRSDRWRDSGDYATLDLAGVPVIVLRDDKGKLRAYANTCRHRGAKLLASQGNCRTVRCPYHSWTYTLGGRLLLTPRMDKTPNFDASQHGLVEVRLADRDGFTFVCLDDQVVPLDEWLGDFSQMHEPWTLNELVSTRRHNVRRRPTDPLRRASRETASLERRATRLNPLRHATKQSAGRCDILRRTSARSGTGAG